MATYNQEAQQPITELKRTTPTSQNKNEDRTNVQPSTSKQSTSSPDEDY